MRIFTNYLEAEGEIKRELKEMGHHVVTQSYQDKHHAPECDTYELYNYGYMITSPSSAEVPVASRVYLDNEWNDRVNGIGDLIRGTFGTNPGKSYLTPRDDIDWSQFLEPQGRFAYTYSERFALNEQVAKVIAALSENPTSRQGYISVWDPYTDPNRLNRRRVPCSLGYHVMIRNDHLNLTYYMRSCEFGTHFRYDVALAIMLQEHIALQCKVEVGMFTHFINSFHVYSTMVAKAF